MSRLKCSNFQKVVEALDTECESCCELMQIRATLLANFSKNDNPYGFVISNEGSTHCMLIEVLKGLTEKKDVKNDEPRWIVKWKHNNEDARVFYSTIQAPGKKHAEILFLRENADEKILTIEPDMKEH